MIVASPNYKLSLFQVSHDKQARAHELIPHMSRSKLLGNVSIYRNLIQEHLIALNSVKRAMCRDRIRITCARLSLFGSGAPFKDSHVLDHDMLESDNAIRPSRGRATPRKEGARGFGGVS